MIRRVDTGGSIGSRLRTGDLLIILPLVYVLALFVLPIGRVLSLGIYDHGFTLRYFYDLLMHPTYLRVLLYTILVSSISTAITALIAYPVGYVIAGSSPKASRLLLAFVIVPLFTSGLIRVYAWASILAPKGVINQLLIYLGVIGQPLNMIYNSFGLYIGNVHILLPYMILSLLSVMRGIDTRLVPAAMTLGASPARAFFTIYFPLTIPGLAAGSVVTFMLSVGAYIIPAALGGARQTMIAMVVETEVMEYLHWGLAAAIASVLLALTVIVVFAQQRWSERGPVGPLR